MMRLVFVLTAFGAIISPTAANAQMAPPTFPPRAAKALADAYPFEALKDGKSAAALVEIWSDPRGSIYRCSLKSSVGDARLAGQVCAILVRRRIEPALDGEGKPAFGRIQTVIRYSTPGSAEAKAVDETVERPDLQLTVNRLPEGKTAFDTELILAVNSTGHVDDCAAKGSEVEGYTSTACAQVSKIMLPAGRGPSDESVPYITDAKVRFLAPLSEKAS